jgi:hypothetical protein
MKNKKQYSSIEIVGIVAIGFFAVIVILTIFQGAIGSTSWNILLSTLGG